MDYSHNNCNYSEVLNLEKYRYYLKIPPKNLVVLYFNCGTIKINSKIWVAVLLFQQYVLFENFKYVG